MHIITYTTRVCGHKREIKFASLSSAVNLIMRLREKNISFTHVFEE
jgi:hypothetical protein